MRRLPLLLGLVLALSCAWTLPALAGSSDDQDIAESSVLTEDDVADYGLSETSPSDDPPPSGAVCKGVRAARKAADAAPNATTAFEDDLGTGLENQVTVFKDVKRAKANLAAYATSKTTRCLEGLIETNLRANLDPGSSYEFDGNRQEIPTGDGGIVYPIMLTITDPDGDVSDTVLEIGVFRVGRAVVGMTTSYADEPFPGSEALATTIADNLESNL